MRKFETIREFLGRCGRAFLHPTFGSAGPLAARGSAAS
jgi:hypothetical protein